MYRPKYTCYCPFYEGEYRKGICCSGIDGSCKTVKYFASEEEKCRFIRKNCVNEHPECCKLYDNLYKEFY